MKIFKNCRFDSTSKTITIEKGNVSSSSYMDIKKSTMVYEDSRFKEKSAPFTHKVLIARWQPMNMREGKVYVGVQLEIKDGTKKNIYISDKPCVSHSSLFIKDWRW